MNNNSYFYLVVTCLAPRSLKFPFQQEDLYDSLGSAARAARTEHQNYGDFFSRSVGGWTSTVKVPRGLLSGKAPPWLADSDVFAQPFLHAPSWYLFLGS